MSDDDTAPPPADDVKVQADEPAPEPDEPEPSPPASEPEPAAPEQEGTTVGPLQPLDPDDPQLRDPAAAVRIMCRREQRCLWAGPTMPDLTVHPDPAAEVKEAAGCFAEPPSCPCANGADDETRDAVDAVALLAPAGIDRDTISVSSLASGGLVGAVSAGTVTPPMLATAEDWGLVSNGRPAPTPLASGQDVPITLEALGVDPNRITTTVFQGGPAASSPDRTSPEGTEP